MHAGDVALVVEVELARAVALVQLGGALVGQAAAGQAFAEEGAEARQVGLWLQVAVDRGQPHRPGTQAVEEGLQALVGVLVAVLDPEAAQVDLAFLVDETVEVVGAARVLVVGQQLHLAPGVLVDIVADQVAQQAHEGQVDRFAQGFQQHRPAAVVFLAEVVEGVQPAAGEEALVGAGRIAPFHGRLEHRGKIAVAAGDQVVDAPAEDEIERLHFHLAQLGDAHAAIVAVDLRDGLQVAGQHP